MSDGQSPTLLRLGDIRQRMQCSGPVAHNIEAAFGSVEHLLETVESEEPLTDVDGIGPKTAGTIEDWYEQREQRERNARGSTITDASFNSMTVSIHQSWADALGIEDGDGE